MCKSIYTESQGVSIIFLGELCLIVRNGKNVLKQSHFLTHIKV